MDSAFGQAIRFLLRLGSRVPRLATLLLPTVLLLTLSTQPTSAQNRASLLLEARNPKALASFYSDVLGLALLDKQPDHAVLDAGGVRLIVVPRSSSDEDAAPNLRLLLPVTEMGMARARLDSAGVAYRPVLSEAGQVVALHFRDPEDNLVGFVRADQSYDLWLATPEFAEGRTRGVSGKTEMAVYGGLHGLWLGVALPIAFEADSPGLYGASMMAAGPLGAIAAYQYAKSHEISKGQARVISLLGTFGIWQGAGWAAHSDADGRSAVLSGALSGLAGIGLGGAIAAQTEVSRGQAEVMVSGANWGWWFGLLGATIADSNSPETLPTTLLTSAAGLALTATYAANADIEVTRMRLINLGGVLGTAFGFGLDLMFEIDDEQTLLTVPAITGALGLALVALRTRPHRDSDDASLLEGHSGPLGVRARVASAPRDEDRGWQTPSLSLAPDGSARFRLLDFRF